MSIYKYERYLEALKSLLTNVWRASCWQVDDVTKHLMTQKEKAEYYRSKLQEIVCL